MTDVAELASELRLAVHRLTRTLRAQRPADGLSLTQISALATIAREGPMSAGDVAAREGVKPPSATRVLARLEEIGLITRTADPQDGRQVLLAASTEGQERLDADMRARDAWLTRRIESLSATERKRLEAALGVLQQLVEQ